MDDPTPLSKRERQIMDLVYSLGQATVKQVADGLPDNPSTTAVRALMLILKRKGHLDETKVGREGLFQPTRTPRKAGRSALRQIVQTFFGGSLERALAAHLSDPRTKLSKEEVARLRALIGKGGRG